MGNNENEMSVCLTVISANGCIRVKKKATRIGPRICSAGGSFAVLAERTATAAFGSALVTNDNWIKNAKYFCFLLYWSILTRNAVSAIDFNWFEIVVQ